MLLGYYHKQSYSVSFDCYHKQSYNMYLIVCLHGVIRLLSQTILHVPFDCYHK